MTIAPLEEQYGTYRFIPYRQVLASKGAGKHPREISVPSARDRGPLKVLVRFMHLTVPESRPSLAQAVVKKLIEAVRHGGYGYFLRVDIENFYPSISHASAIAAIHRFVTVVEARVVLENAVRTPTLRMNVSSSGVVSQRGVPQGLSISNSLAELVMHDLDQSWLSKPGVSYFRYVDDILILTKRVSHRKTFRAIQEAVLPLGLKCHDLQTSGSKSTWGVLADQVDYLGYSVGRNLVSVRAESVMRLKEKLAHRFLRFAKALKEPHESSADEWRKSCESRLEWYLNLTIAGCVLDDHRRGWIHYFSLVTDFGLLRSLDYFVEKKVSSLRLSPVLSVKSFVRAYRRAARVGPDRSGYVPNFDRFSETEQRRTLLDIFLISPDRVDRMSSPEVETEFYRRLRRELESLETDLAIAY